MSTYKVCRDISGWKEFWVEAESLEDAKAKFENFEYTGKHPDVAEGDVEYYDCDTGAIYRVGLEEEEMSL